MTFTLVTPSDCTEPICAGDLQNIVDTIQCMHNNATNHFTISKQFAQTVPASNPGFPFWIIITPLECNHTNLDRV